MTAEFKKQKYAYYRCTGYRGKCDLPYNLTVVVDDLLIQKLETQFDAELKSGEAQKTLVMFAPTYLREEASGVDSYVFGRMSKTPRF